MTARRVILRAQGDRESRILRAQGEGQAILTVFQSIHDGSPDQALLAYQYLQMLPKIAEGDANKVWIIPSEIGKALEGLGSTFSSIQGIPHDDAVAASTRVDYGDAGRRRPAGRPNRATRRSRRPTKRWPQAIASAEEAARPGRHGHAARHRQRRARPAARRSRPPANLRRRASPLEPPSRLKAASQ